MRIPVLKTLKLYVGGEFIRSESGRTLPIRSARGEPMYACRASRKDLRQAMETARKAQPGWEKRSAYNRGQILYRLGEMIEDRRASFPTASEDVDAAADRAVHHAGWADKVSAVLSTLNPVSTAFVNYSMVRATGVAVAVPHPDDGLLGLVEAVCAPLLMGNTVMVLVPDSRAELATAFAEALATCDMPAGAVAIMTADMPEVLGVADILDDLDLLVVAEGAVSDELVARSEAAAAHVMRRVVRSARAAHPAGPNELARLTEVKTVWMSS